MKKLVVSLFILHSSFFICQAAVRHLHGIEVVEGESVSLNAENALEVKTGNPSVATASIRENELSVLGTGLGQTDLFLVDGRGVFADARVTVRPSYWSVLKRLFDDDPEITMEIVGGKVVLSGSTASSAALKRVTEAKALDAARIISQVSFSPEALQVIVQDFVNRAGYTNVTARTIGREVCLHGKVYDMGTAKSLGERLKRFLVDFPQVTVNWEELQVLKQKIVIDIDFVEWNDTRSKNLGIEPPKSVEVSADFEYGWDFTRNYERKLSDSMENSLTDKRHTKEGGTATTGDSGGTGGTGGSGTSLLPADPRPENDSGIDRTGKYNPSRDNSRKHEFTTKSKLQVNDVKAKINLAKENGVARSAYATQLVTQSGEDVEFQNGGTVYTSVQGGVGATGDLRQFNYGYVVNAKPVIVDMDTLNLDFNVECSSIDNQAGLKTGDYKVLRYRTKSKYTVRPGETIVLSGYDQTDEGSTKTGWPLLSYIPVLNWIFGNRSTSSDRKEMLLVVTVNWAVEDSETAKRRIKEMRDRKVDAEMP